MVKKRSGYWDRVCVLRLNARGEATGGSDQVGDQIHFGGFCHRVAGSIEVLDVY
jgi:hypothetical protein